MPHNLATQKAFDEDQELSEAGITDTRFDLPYEGKNLLEEFLAAMRKPKMNLKPDSNAKAGKKLTTSTPNDLDPVEDWRRRLNLTQMTPAEKDQTTQVLIKLLRARRMNKAKMAQTEPDDAADAPDSSATIEESESVTCSPT